MELSEEQERKALQAAREMKGALNVDTLPATSETTEEMRTGSPRTPGVDEHSGKTMKKPAEYDSEPKGSLPTDPQPGVNAFDQALAEKLQEATPASPDKPRDIDR